MTEAPDPPRRRPTIIDVARRAGVSPQTVSNVVQRLKVPRPDTLARVTEAVEALGYAPNAAARALRSQRSETIAVLLEDPDGLGLADPLHAEFLQGVCRAARRLGQAVIVDFTDPGETDALAASLIGDRRAGGLVLSLGRIGPRRGRALAAIARTGAAVVLLQQDVRLAGVSTIRAEDREGAAEAVRHLHAKGHRSLLFLGASPDWPAPLRRLDGVREACAALGIGLAERRAPAFTMEAARTAMAAHLAADPRATAVVAVNDLVALGAMEELRAQGRRVPQDCAVIGFNDFPFSGWIDPGISTVAIPGQAMGERAAEMAAAGPGFEQPRDVVFGARLVLRGSTGDGGGDGGRSVR